VAVPYWEWNALKGREEKRDFVRVMLKHVETKAG